MRSLMCVLILLLSPWLAAEESPTFVEGRDYSVLETPLPAGVAPLTQFFYYGCRACSQMAEPLAGWSAEKGIALGLVPAHTDTALVDAARLYHSLMLLGHAEHYRAGYVLFQTEQQSAEGEARVNEFLDEIGQDREAFWATWGGEEVNQRLAGSFMLTRAAAVATTPAFVVHGRYKIEMATIEDVQELFELIEFLVAERAPAAKTPS